MQVADGMHFLAKSNVVHCNLSLANVWVGQTNTAKVANFIAARRMELQGSRMCYRRTDHAVVVNFKWQSPEVSLSLTFTGSTVAFNVFSTLSVPFRTFLFPSLSDLVNDHTRPLTDVNVAHISSFRAWALGPYRTGVYDGL